MFIEVAIPNLRRRFGIAETIAIMTSRHKTILCLKNASMMSSVTLAEWLLMLALVLVQ
jgi:hypothetical protein